LITSSIRLRSLVVFCFLLYKTIRVSSNSVLVSFFCVMSSNLSTKFAGALDEESKGENLSEGVIMTPGASSDLYSNKSASSTGPVAFCLDDIGLGGTACGGLIQGSSTALGTRMCVEPLVGTLARCIVKSHDTKAPVPLQMSRNSAGLFWFLRGVSKGRKLITLDQCWDCAVISRDVLQGISPVPTNVGEWVLLLDGLSDVGAPTSPAALQEFAARVSSHPLAVTPRVKKVRYDRGPARTPDAWENFVDVDMSSLNSDSATSATIQRRMRETIPVVSANVDSLRAAIKGITQDLGGFSKKVGNDLDQQESLLLQLRTELGRRPSEVGASTVWQHVESLNEAVDTVKATVAPSALEAQIQPFLEKALEKIVMGELVDIVKPAFLLAKRYTTRVGAPAGDKLEARLHMLERGQAAGPAPLPVPHPRAAPTVAAGLATLSEARFAMIEAQLVSQAASIASLKAESLVQTNLISQLRSAMASNICEVGDESFDSEVVAQAFAVNHCYATMPTCSFDVVSLLQVAHHEVADTAQAVQEGSNATKAGFKNPLQAAVASSYQIHIPTFLGGSKSASISGAGMFPLPALKVHKAWDDNSTISQRSYVESSVKNAVKSLVALINQSSLTSPGKSLAREMINNSANTIEKLFMFMDRFYGELCNTYGTDAVEAWHLVSSIARRFFSDLYAVRGSARYMSLASQSPAVVGGSYLWAALQAHRIMQEYVAAEFRHHPSVSPVITIHLYSHRVPISIFERRSAKVDDTLKKLADGVKTANTTAGQALKKANG
jgi:hypothetical protein